MSIDASGPELEILKLLWQHRRLSAREIHQHIEQSRDWAYSTTRTVLERMVKKEQLHKETVHGLIVYAPAVEKVPTLVAMITEFTSRVLGIRPSAAIPMFAESELLDKDELKEIEALLEADKKRGKKERK